jgi:hypothetical protein
MGGATDLRPRNVDHRRCVQAVVLIGLLMGAGSGDCHAEQPEARSARAWLAFGAEAYRNGDAARAVDAFTAAARAFDAAADEQGRLDALVRRAEAFDALRLPGDAAIDLETCQRLARIGDRAILPDGFEVLLARVSANLDQSGRAQTLLRQAIARAEQRTDSRTLAAAQLDLAALLAAERRHAEALPASNAALVSAEATGDPPVIAAALINRANALAAASTAGDPLAEASDLLARADEQIRRTPSPRAQAELRLAYAEALLKVRNAWPDHPASRAWLKSTYRALRAAAEWAGKAGDRRGLVQTSQLMGRVYESEGLDEQALWLAQEARRYAGEAGDRDLMFSTNLRIGRLLAAHGDRDNAIAAYQQSTEALHALRRAHEPSAGRGVREGAGQAYLELADLLMKRAEAVPADRAKDDLARAREAIEDLKAAELQDYFGDDCVTALRAKRRPLDALVTAGTAALYPIVFADRTELLLTTAGRIHRVTVPVGVDRMAAEAEALRMRLERVATWQFLPHARQIYDWLLRPLEPYLDGDTQTLVFVPDGPLRTIPIAALHDGTRFVAERFATAVAPGVDLLDVRPFAGTARPDVLIAAVGSPVGDLPALPAVGGAV